MQLILMPVGHCKYHYNCI